VCAPCFVEIIGGVNEPRHGNGPPGDRAYQRVVHDGPGEDQ
jgi:hypothetical protein